MIYYLCTRKHADTVGILLGFYPGHLSEEVRILPYEDVFRIQQLVSGVFIFTDFDRLTPDVLDRAGRLYEFLKAGPAPVRVLNNPAVAPLRFELLRRMRDAGINDFDVYRLGEANRVRRYPVFIRHERGHRKPVSPLLLSAADLGNAITALGPRDRSADDMMIVEFCNELTAEGRYRKYGAFRVGDVIYAQHCFTRESWHVKTPRYKGPVEDRRVHDSYVRDNPHAEQLRAIFDLARIDYGRIDYAVVGGRIQVYEINTNPTVLDDGPRSDIDFDSGIYARMHENAMAMLAPAAPGAVISLPKDLHDRSSGAIDPNRVHLDVMREVKARLWFRQRRSRIEEIARRIFSGGPG